MLLILEFYLIKRYMHQSPRPYIHFYSFTAVHFVVCGGVLRRIGGCSGVVSPICDWCWLAVSCVVLYWCHGKRSWWSWPKLLFSLYVFIAWVSSHKKWTWRFRKFSDSTAPVLRFLGVFLYFFRYSNVMLLTTTSSASHDTLRQKVLLSFPCKKHLTDQPSYADSWLA